MEKKEIKFGNKVNIFEALLSIPKILYVNFKLLPFKQAIKIPIIISYHIKLFGINKKNLIIESKDLKFRSIRIGFGMSAYGGFRESKKGAFILCNGGKVMLKGKAGFSQGIVLVANNSTICFGDGFKCNYSTTISAVNSNIDFGKHVICGWKVTIRNHDGHYILENGIEKINNAPILIGENVWLCSDSTVLKGVEIGKNSVVACNALLTSAKGQSEVLFAGAPAKVIRENITWHP